MAPATHEREVELIPAGTARKLARERIKLSKGANFYVAE